jgi:Flp pilus assembly protein TadG
MVSIAGSRPGPRGDDGAAAVEFVLVVPILLLLVFGIVNFGYLFGQKLSLNQAVREGARMAVVPGGPRSGPAGSINEFNYVRDQVRGSTGGLISNTGSVTVTLSASEGCETLDVGDQLTVTATYPAATIFPQFLPGVPNPVNLTSKAVYRCEWGR